MFRFVICATDGLWKVFKTAEAIKYVHDKYVEKRQNGQNPNEVFESIADSLGSESVLRGCADNITVVIVAFKQNLSKL